MKKKCSSFADCPEGKSFFLNKKDYEIVQCKTCGHRFTTLKNVDSHLEEVYSDAYFFEGKDGYPNYLKEKDLLYKSGLNYSKILSKYTSPGKILDVGCAAGFILDGFKDTGWDCYGVEPNSTMAAYGRDELKLNIKTGSLEEYKDMDNFDVVNLIQVIGSLYDLELSMANINKLLKPGGFVMVESWDMESIAARMMGKSWHEYCPPSVINWFSDKTLSQLFSYYGFETVAKGRPSKKININHGLSLVDESLPKIPLKKPVLAFFSHAVGKYNVTYPPVDLKWYLFKKVRQ